MAELKQIFESYKNIEELDNAYSALFNLLNSFSNFEDWDFKELNILEKLADSIATTHLFGGINNFNNNGNVFQMSLPDTIIR